jgi:hypothetical protein
VTRDRLRTNREFGSAPINASERRWAAVKAARSAPEKATLTVAGKAQRECWFGGACTPLHTMSCGPLARVR